MFQRISRSSFNDKIATKSSSQFDSRPFAEPPTKRYVQRAILRTTPRGTKIRITNPREPFYLAVGQIEGASSREGMLKVEFEVKPGKFYDVPLQDMDLYNAASSFYGNAEEGGARITGMPSLVQFLREKYRGRWAITGSVALSMWAEKYGVEFRAPHDMDIVVDGLFGAYILFASAMGAYPRPPGPTADHKTVDLGMFSLDIIADGMGLGELGEVAVVNGVPVNDLGTIAKYKRMRGEPKDIEDLAVIEAILSRARR